MHCYFVVVVDSLPVLHSNEQHSLQINNNNLETRNYLKLNNYIVSCEMPFLSLERKIFAFISICLVMENFLKNGGREGIIVIIYCPRRVPAITI